MTPSSNQYLLNLAMARTLCFNYGQGMWTPLWIFKDACVMMGVSPSLSSLPSFKEIPFAWSFFSKRFKPPCINQPCHHILLYSFYEREQFLSQPSAVKLNWLRNFTYMQELLFNFSSEDIARVFEILRQRPRVLEEKLPFQLSSSQAQPV